MTIVRVDPPRVGWLDSWSGGRRVEVIGVSPEGYLIRAVSRMRLGRKVLKPGDEAMIAKHHVRCGVIP